MSVTLKELINIFGGEFRTKRKIYSLIDGKLYSWIDGRQTETIKEETDLNKVIKNEVWGC